MIELHDTCFVLRKGHFRESDIWLKVLSPSYGVITLFAFGGAKSKRRFCGCLDVFNTLDCRITLSSRKKYYILNEATLLAGQGSLRNNWRRMGEAFNCLAFLEALYIDIDSCRQCFNLLEDLRTTLQAARELPSLFVLFFRFRISCLLGYNPELNICLSCGAKPGDDAYFAYDEGRIYCSQCQSHQSMTKKIRLSKPGLDLLREVKQTFPSQWIETGLMSDIKRSCGLAMDSFVQYHLGIAYSNGYFRRI